MRTVFKNTQKELHFMRVYETKENVFVIEFPISLLKTPFFGENSVNALNKSLLNCKVCGIKKNIAWQVSVRICG